MNELGSGLPLPLHSEGKGTVSDDSALDTKGADGDVETVAAERIRNGAAERTEEGIEALHDLDIRPE